LNPEIDLIGADYSPAAHRTDAAFAHLSAE
jgi:hypothetical protein